MLNRLWLALDLRRWPQRLVAWAARRRSKSDIAKYLLPSSGATHAVTWTVASPTLATRDLMLAALPRGFGSWRDYRVHSRLVDGSIVVMILEEPRSKERFSLVLPRHEDFSHWRFKRLKMVRMTCEAERSSLMTLRHRDGRLIAAGTLELAPRASFSQEVRP